MVLLEVVVLDDLLHLQEVVVQEEVAQEATEAWEAQEVTHQEVLQLEAVAQEVAQNLQVEKATTLLERKRTKDKSIF